MSNSVSVSANISEELSRKLERVARHDERSKSYYIQKSLEYYLQERLEDIEDYHEAKDLYEAHIASGEDTVPIDEVFKNVH